MVCQSTDADLAFCVGRAHVWKGVLNVMKTLCYVPNVIDDIVVVFEAFWLESVQHKRALRVRLLSVIR